MTQHSLKYPEKVDLDNCAREPIHVIGKSQAHGVLLICDPENLQILQAGINSSDFFSIPHAELLGKPLADFIDAGHVEKLRNLEAGVENPLPLEVLINQQKFLVLPHYSGSSLVLDFEPLEEKHDPFFFQKQLSRVLNNFENSKSTHELVNRAASLTKELFGYDRVMVYRFDEEWNGEVIAERKEEDMESWLGLHYPATDIPPQSREIFLKHRVRTIVDVHAASVPLEPEISPVTGSAVDISLSSLRAVSPIHIEYLKNMGVGASLSAAIVIRGKLWGLIACHHRSSKFVDYYQREACRFLVQMLSTELALQETKSFIHRRQIAELKRNELVLQMQQEPDIMEALAGEGIRFTDLISCGGGALYFRKRWRFSGATPEKDEVQDLFDNFLSKQKESLYYVNNLSAVYSKAEAYKKVASGVMSLRIAESKYIIWFRPEVIQTVNWGGNPEKKAFYDEEKQRLSPRKSFEKWSEKLTGRSEAWDDSDVNIAGALRENVSYVVLAKQRREIEALNKKLLEANSELELFSYGLSHDLRAPIRGMEGYLTIIQEDHSAEIDPEGREILTLAKDLTFRMNQLIDDILEYSQLSQTKGLEKKEVDVEKLIAEIVALFNVKQNYPQTKLIIDKDLPGMKGDGRMIFQLWSNLLTNAFKYSGKKDTPEVQVGTEKRGDKTFFVVKDNGIGIKEEFSEKIFDTFTRVAGKGFTGSGIGLAIVKKIIEKHRGEIFVESSPNNGSAFYFTFGE